MTRTRRVAGSVALSLMSQVVAMVVGLWLTRFILDTLGQSTLGLWLIILQALGLLALADLGVVAVLPRQTAFVTGRDGAPGALGELVGRATLVGPRVGLVASTKLDPPARRNSSTFLARPRNPA